MARAQYICTTNNGAITINPGLLDLRRSVVAKQSEYYQSECNDSPANVQATKFSVHHAIATISAHHEFKFRCFHKIS